MKRTFSVAFALILLLAGPSFAQDLSLNLGDGASVSARSIQLILLITVLSIAPGAAVMVTCFPFIVTVLSILRQAIGLQQAPPNMLIVSLAMFLTWYVMDPVFTQAWENGIGPLTREEIDIGGAISQTLAPFRAFMAARLDPGTFANLAQLRPGLLPVNIPDAPLSVLVPAFMLSEIKLAFEIGFLVFLPSLIASALVRSYM